MPAWTMPGTPVKDQLLAHVRTVLPVDFTTPSRGQEELHALAMMFKMAEAQLADWHRQTVISTSEGPWLIEHARGRGYSPQAGETDATLRARIRVPPDAVTVPALLAIVNAILTGGGVSGMARIEEVPMPQGAFVGNAPASGVRSFLDRGYRTWKHGKGHAVVVVPFGTPAGVQASVLEAVRTKRGHSVTYHLEVATS